MSALGTVKLSAFGMQVSVCTFAPEALYVFRSGYAFVSLLFVLVTLSVNRVFSFASISFPNL